MEGVNGFTGTQLLLHPEAEAIVKGLEPFHIGEVGTKRWQEQRKHVERLNCQAHYNTATKASEDFVVQELILQDKVSLLIHELLVMEQWRRKVYSRIRKELLEQNPACLYTLLYYEGVLVNLLELVFWTEDGVTCCGDDLLEVLDYLWRNINTLIMHSDDGYWPSATDPEDAKKLVADPERSHLDSERRQEFTICMTSISVLWFIIDKLKVLPMSALNNILHKNDVPVGLSLLIDNRPWLRRGPKGMEKYKTKEWKPVSGADVMVVCEYEAHAWFILHVLLTSQICREKYSYNTWRKDQILRCRKFLNEVLVDQIPPLIEVQRALDELSFLDPPPATQEKFRSSLVIEPVPRLLDSITRGTDWDKLAEEHKKRLTDKATVMEQSKDMVAVLDQIMASMGGSDEDALKDIDMSKLLQELQAAN